MDSFQSFNVKCVWPFLAVFRTVHTHALQNMFYWKKMKPGRSLSLMRGLDSLSLRRIAPVRGGEKNKIVAVFLHPFSFHTLNTGCCSKTVTLMTQQRATACHYFATVLSVLCQSSAPTRRLMNNTSKMRPWLPCRRGEAPRCVTLTWIWHTLLLQQMNAWFV